MQGFLYLSVAPAMPPAYGQPLLAWVSRAFPATAVLDVDAQSDELLQHYALRLLRETEQAVVCISVAAETADISQMMYLLEELFQPEKKRLVILMGQHPRLQRIFAARPFIRFLQSNKEEEAKEAVMRFFS